MNMLLPYLLLLSFSFHSLQGELAVNDWSSVVGSPYDGVSLSLIDCFSTEPMDHDRLLLDMKKFKKDTGKDGWPMVYINRMIGSRETSRSHPSQKPEQRAFFAAINGMDVHDRAGARTAFLGYWRTALMLSRETGTPGVILDLEAYNDYQMYDIDSIASAQRESPELVAAGLDSLGSDMADIAAKERPDAVVWTLFTVLAEPDKSRKNGHSVAYIIKGFLDRCLEKGYRMKVVSGGEVWINYCSESMDDLRGKIALRQTAYAGLLDRYRDNFALGGTVAPWFDSSERKGWAVKRCSDRQFRKLPDFVPYFQELKKNYDYVWIYAAWGCGYDPTKKADAARYNPVIASVFKPDWKPMVDPPAQKVELPVQKVATTVQKAAPVAGTGKKKWPKTKKQR